MKPLTYPVARAAIRWYQGVLHMRDWRITVEIHDGCPGWRTIEPGSPVCGSIQILPRHQAARIWVSNQRCATTALHCDWASAIPADPLAVLFHECEHVRATRDRTALPGDTMTDAQEFSYTCVGTMLAQYYRLVQCHKATTK